MLIGIVDSGGANLASVEFAVKRAGFESFLSADYKLLETADKLILPGVGAADKVMQNLQNKDLLSFLRNSGKPMLGICLGMQILFEYSEEGEVECLGLIPGQVRCIPKTENFSIPHMGWNQLTKLHQSPILEGLADNSHVYFVHSYYAEVSKYCLASTNYNIPMAAVVGRAEVWGCQFHPEKSGAVGTQILKNFCQNFESRNL